MKVTSMKVQVLGLAMMILLQGIASSWASPAVTDQLSPAKTAPVARDSCWTFAETKQFIHANMVMKLERTAVRLRIPLVDIVNPWDRRNGDFQALYFEMEYGSFRPLTAPETAGKDTIAFLIHDTIPLEQTAQVFLEVMMRQSSLPLSRYPTRLAQFGLTEVVADQTKGLKWDLFLQRSDEGTLETYVGCSRPDPLWGPFPRCQQYFRAAGLDVEVGYAREHLAQWREMKAAVSQFLACAKSGDQSGE